MGVRSKPHEGLCDGAHFQVRASKSKGISWQKTNDWQKMTMPQVHNWQVWGNKRIVALKISSSFLPFYVSSGKHHKTLVEMGWLPCKWEILVLISWYFETIPPMQCCIEFVYKEKGSYPENMQILLQVQGKPCQTAILILVWSVIIYIIPALCLLSLWI